jgi:Protein of unknown function (DUF2783)
MKTTFSTAANLQDADGFTEALLDAHKDLTREQSEALNARLIFLLANQIGDTQTLLACIDAAKSSE